LTRTELGLTISQLIFDGFRVSADSDRLAYESEAARMELFANAENIALDVSRLYLDIQKAEEILELASRNVEDHVNVHNDIKTRLGKGVSSQADFAQISARVASSKSARISAHNNLMDLKVQFIRIVGDSAEELVKPVADNSIVPSKIDEVIDNARAFHPEIKAAIADLQAAQEEFRGAKHSYYPNVFLEAGINKNDNVSGFKGADEDAHIMLRLSYDLYDGGRRKGRSESSGWRYEQANAIRRKVEKQVVEGAKLSWNARTLLRLQEELLQQNVDAAKAAEVGYQQQYDVGRRSLLDVLDAKIEVFLARKNFINTHYDRLYAEYRIINSMGMLMYSLRIAHPEEWKNTQVDNDD